MKDIVKRASAGAVCGAALLFTGGMGVASAQPVNLQDGLINVAIGDVTILEDVNVGVAASVATAICGVQVIDDIGVLAEQVDVGSGPVTACEVPGGDVNLVQNAGTPGQSGQAPGGGPAGAPGNPQPGGPNR